MRYVFPVRSIALIIVILLLNNPVTAIEPSSSSGKSHDIYRNVVNRVTSDQRRYVIRYQSRNSISGRRQLLRQSDDYIFNTIYKKLMPHWYGTAWDYNGTTRTPGKGAIACGYFVSTVLQDAGFRVERIRLAQQASERIVRSLAVNNKLKRYSRVPIKRFIQDIEKWGKGIYIVGLDLHVGFIVHDGSEVYFIHSTYIPPTRVIKERARDSEILAASQYRVLAKLSGDRGLLKKWIQHRRISTIRH